MSDKGRKKRLLKFFEKYFKESATISLEDDEFYNKLVERMIINYKKEIEWHKKNNDNSFAEREKTVLKAKIKASEDFKSDFKYSPILITSAVTITTFGLDLIYRIGTDSITQMISNKLKDVSSQSVINNANEVIKSTSNFFINSSVNTIFEFFVCIGIFITAIQLHELYQKNKEVDRTSFYRLCYDTLCAITEGKL